MNFFFKKKLIFWLLIFLLVINLSVLITIAVFYSRNAGLSARQSEVKPGMAFQRELALTPAQSEQVELILSEYRNSTGPIRTSIRNYRSALLEELAKSNPDTILLDSCMDEIYLRQKLMQKASVKQYLELKKICTPAQCVRLSELYFELYGFQGKGQGMGKGKGMMHQYRRGQGQQGPGNRMGNDSSGK